MAKVEDCPGFETFGKDVQLAREAVGLSHKAISTIESGARSTTIEKLIALADFFGVTMDYLIGREPPSGGPPCPIPTDRR